MDDERDPGALLQRAGDVIGGYVLRGVLGVGGMGVVYSATQSSLDRTVALKLPLPELAADSVTRRRFRTEARAGSRLNHPNIVRVLDFGEDVGVPYLVLEHVIGVGLGQVALDHGAMSVGMAANLVGQVLAGLEDAHAHGIVHADVKSENLLVETQRDGSAVTRLFDFGIARFVDDDDPEEDGVLVTGTPEYLAPELIRGERPSFASDVYAVGVLLYDLISGSNPFAGGSRLEIMNRQCEVDPVPLSWRCATGSVSRALDDVLACALAKRPAERFADAAAFRRVLGEVVASQPLTIVPRELDDAHAEAITAPLAIEAPSREAPALEERRAAVVEAVARGDADGIVVSYLELAHAHVDRHQLAMAILALEHGLDLLGGTGPAWRLMLTLAALYDGTGNRARAHSTARAAGEHAERSGSAVGQARADALLARLGRPAPDRPRRRRR